MQEPPRYLQEPPHYLREATRSGTEQPAYRAEPRGDDEKRARDGT
jgi:hypothetical protein